MTTETELAWAAGFFDGEGTCCMRKSGQGGRAAEHYYIGYTTLAIVQTDLRPLERFLAAVGVGTLADANSRTRVAKGWKPAWRWQTSARSDVGATIRLLWPYLSEPKREQITAVERCVASNGMERRLMFPGRWARA